MPRRANLVFLLLLFWMSTSAFAAEWSEVHSPNFVIVTNAGEGRGREVALRFEQMRRIFGNLLQRQQVTTVAPLQVLAFKSNRDLKQVLPLWKGKPISAAGLYINGGDRNFIALDLSSEEAWRVVFHEYAHMLLSANYPPTQLWFDEGFAEYYSTIRVGRKEIEIGLPPPYPPGTFSLDANWIPIEQLFSVDTHSRDYNEDGDRRGRFYAQSWLVVHYLFDTQKLAQTGKYFDLVMNQHVTLPQAIQQAFGMEVKQFDRTIRDFAHSDKAKSFTYDTPPGMDSVTYQSHGLKDYEAQTLIADMQAHIEGYQDRAQKELEAVIGAHPEVAEAHRILGYLALRQDDLRTASQHLRDAAELGTTDAQVYLLMARLLRKQLLDSQVRDPALLVAINDYAAKALRINSELAEAWVLRAFALEQTDSDRAAIEALQQAVKLSPREERYQLELAREFANVQRFDESMALYKHLQSSKDPEIARQANEQAQMVQQWKEKPVLQLAKEHRQYTAPQWQRRAGEKQDTDLQEIEEAQRGQQRETAADTRPMKFLKGKLSSVDCSKFPQAVVEVTVGKRVYTLHTQDAAALVLIGADKFSCEWKGLTVSANYKASGPSSGDLVSLEVH